MHPSAADPQVRTQVRAASDVDVACDLLVDGLWVDISDDLVKAGQVGYQVDRTLHRTGQVTLSRELNWGSDRIRVRYQVGSVEVAVGTFIVSTPVEAAEETPRSWTVDVYDLLWLLDDLYGSTFVAEQGQGFLATVRGLVEPVGLPLLLADEAGGERTISDDRVFPLDEELTRLQIVNRLLRTVGYRDLWVDGQGRARSEPIVGLANRGSEWLYDATSEVTEVGAATRERDTFGRVNRLVALSDDPDADLEPVTLVVDDGLPTRTELVRLEAADQAALQVQAEAAFEKSRQVEDVVEVQVSPNPLHSHRDVVRLVHPDLDVDAKHLVRSWTLPLDGSDMTLELERIV